MALLTSRRTRWRSSEARSSAVRDSTRPCRFAVRLGSSPTRRRSSISDIADVARTRRIPISSSVQSRGCSVHDAERPEGVSLGGDQRDPRVGDHPELGEAGYAPEKRILPGVRHDEWLARLHGMLAERVRQRGLPQGRERLGQPALTLEEHADRRPPARRAPPARGARSSPGASTGRTPPRAGNRGATSAAAL